MRTRRSFLKRLAAASLAFSVAPGVFKAMPAARNVRNEIMSARVAKLTGKSLDLHEWIKINYEIMRARKAQKTFIDTFWDDDKMKIDPERWKNLHLTAPNGHYTGPNVKHLFPRHSIATQS